MNRNVYDEVDDLLADIRKDIDNVLKNEVFNKVRDIELEHIESDVFHVYAPTIYRRRGIEGLDDPKNTVGTVKNGVLEVENVTQFNTSYGGANSGLGLADLVNDGNGRSGYYYDFSGEFTRPRPFIDNTIKHINQTNEVDKAFEKGMKKEGY